MPHGDLRTLPKDWISPEPIYPNVISLAYQLAPHKINVNSVCPGVLWTELWHDLSARQIKAAGNSDRSGREQFEQRFAGIPLGREQTPEDVGNAVAFLASDRAKNITGQSLNVDGGTMMN